MPTPSARLGIPNYTESDTPVDIPTAWLARSAVLDTLVPISAGTLVQRPTSSPSTAGIVGRQAIVTGEVDSPRLDLDLGASWITVGPALKDGPPSVPSSRSLGTGANQAAPGNSTSLFMPGDLKISAAIATPSGWLLCDGSAVSRTTYAALYAAIQSAFGGGDGSTTFNIPDYRGRTIVGAGNGPGLTGRALGYKSGEETHQITNGEMPVHSHAGATGWMDRSTPHAHGIWISEGGSTAQWAPGYVGTASIPGTVQTGATDVNHLHAVNSDGGNGYHNNMQPFGVCNVFIKT
jgi:microcystin-dependent protein